MAEPARKRLTFVLIARIPLEGIGAFQAYESAVLPVLAEHGARLERRLRSETGTIELHIVSFASEAAFEAYRADPRRTALAPDLARSNAQLELLPLEDVTA
ncbi:MAG TPA: hypothetical protein PK264_13060 [Hyphomicrobiaceae bacterium]|nr:hypothetical protein [Hyphomicrobiaceae bacterium]